MTRTALELATQRRVTRAFVNANYEDIVLTPRERDKTSTGGVKYVELEPRPAQRFHVIERNTQVTTDARVPGGRQDDQDLTLLGYHDAQIGRHDIFTLRGQEWEVNKIEWDNGYERRASVVRYGRA